eukprot:scaffold3862_cov201-Alexandrium_tamarense.AAC.11
MKDVADAILARDDTNQQMRKSYPTDQEIACLQATSSRCQRINSKGPGLASESYIIVKGGETKQPIHFLQSDRTPKCKTNKGIVSTSTHYVTNFELSASDSAPFHLLSNALGSTNYAVPSADGLRSVMLTESGIWNTQRPANIKVISELDTLFISIR